MKNAYAQLDEVVALREENAALRAQIAWLKQKLFGGAKSEKLDQAQLRFQLEELEKLAAQSEARVQTITYERAKVAKEARQVPAEAFAHLPVVETIEIVPEAVKSDPELYERIGEERTFEVDVIEPKLVKREIVRPKYRHKLDRNRPPLLAAAPARVVPGGYASAGLLAWIAINKYVHHLPLYRLEQMSQRWGAQISRRTMSDWIGSHGQLARTHLSENACRPSCRRLHPSRRDSGPM